MGGRAVEGTGLEMRPKHSRIVTPGLEMAQFS